MKNQELIAQFAKTLATRWCGPSPAVKDTSKAASNFFEQLLTRSDEAVRKKYRLGIMPVLSQLINPKGNSGDVLESMDNLARIILDQLPPEMRSLEELVRSAEKGTDETTEGKPSSPSKSQQKIATEAPKLWQALIQTPEFVSNIGEIARASKQGRWDPTQFKRWINRIRTVIPGDCAEVAQAVILSAERIFPKFGLAFASASAVELTLGSIFRSSSETGMAVHSLLAEKAAYRLETVSSRIFTTSRELLIVSDDTAYRLKQAPQSKKSLQDAAKEILRERNDHTLDILLEARGVQDQLAGKAPFFRAKGTRKSREDMIIFSDPDDSTKCSFFWSYQKTQPQIYEIKPVAGAIDATVQVFAYMMNYNVASLFYECKDRHSCNPFMQLAPPTTNILHFPDVGPISGFADVLKTGFWTTNKSPFLIIPFMVETMPGVVLYIAPSLDQLALTAFLATLKVLIAEIQRLLQKLQSNVKEGEIVGWAMLLGVVIALIVVGLLAGLASGAVAGTPAGPAGAAGGGAAGGITGLGLGLAAAAVLLLFVFSGEQSQPETNPPVTIYLGNMVFKDIPVKTFAQVLVDTQKLLRDIFSEERPLVS
jgi:hypothetical protein